MIQTLGLIAAVAMPLWNIPLIVRIGQRVARRSVSSTCAGPSGHPGAVAGPAAKGKS